LKPQSVTCRVDHQVRTDRLVVWTRLDYSREPDAAGRIPPLECRTRSALITDVREYFPVSALHVRARHRHHFYSYLSEISRIVFCLGAPLMPTTLLQPSLIWRNSHNGYAKLAALFLWSRPSASCPNSGGSFQESRHMGTATQWLTLMHTLPVVRRDAVEGAPGICRHP
jgi:hypothetical protein